MIMLGGSVACQCVCATHTWHNICSLLSALCSAPLSGLLWSQSGCIMTAAPIVGGGGGNCAAVDGWQACGSDISSCTTTQMYAVVAYQGQFATQLTTVPSFGLEQNNAFIHSCFTHCAAMGDAFFTSIDINGVSLCAVFLSLYCTRTI